MKSIPFVMFALALLLSGCGEPSECEMAVVRANEVFLRFYDTDKSDGEIILLPLRACETIEEYESAKPDMDTQGMRAFLVWDCAAPPTPTYAARFACALQDSDEEYRLCDNVREQYEHENFADVADYYATLHNCR